ncbi:MAG TPA: UDP-N-acetylglucosamine--N-acetylmuramyl-(pentapeptide) pyrophosphoryl-undecaprenol N-acetylglucosamine transferase [Candidatus Dormibacteraeota bacterium]|nr:UDP-N-acetylglucosamine--N-acetylmuramyl-(pentapeptide) pyrophosphoryl-undecaprenol N-acetylglucosamine transferase [Candidatus Dormibacteraeota bacterium]
MAEALRQTDPEVVVNYVGRADGPEASLVPEAGLDFSGLRLGSMGSSARSSAPRLALRLPLAYGQAVRLVRRFQPQVVLATGGYVCVPVALAARRRRVPVVLLEQNMLPGRAVQWLSPRVQRVASSFPATAALLPRAKVVCTGNPVRTSFAALASRPQLPEAPPTLLVMGGSQGARSLNEVLLEALPSLLKHLPELKVVHLTGPTDFDQVVTVAEERGLPVGDAYQPSPFVTDVAERLAAASLVVMRAGGSSLAEVACLGRPMVLVPYPHASEHQSANAEPFEAAGAALLISDPDLTPELLEEAVLRVLGDPQRWATMARASSSMARPQAAQDVALLLQQLAQTRG